MLRCRQTGTGFAFWSPGITRFFCALALLAAIPRAHATTWIWTGNGGNVNWSTIANWNMATAPASSSSTDLNFAGSNNTGTLATPLNQNIAPTFQLNTLSFAVGSGSFFLGGNALAFTGASNTIVQGSSNAQSIANDIVNPGSKPTILTLTGNGSGIVTLSGVISIGGGGKDYAITKTGPSTFTLSGTNTYGGATTISAGVLRIQNASALGSIASGTTVASGAALQIQGGIAVGTEALTLNGSGIANDGAFRNVSGNNSFAGAITFASASTISSDAGTLTLTGNVNNGGFLFTENGAGNVTITSVISGAGGLTKNGAGTLTLSGAASNTYTGATTVNQGTLILAKPGSVLAPAITIGGAGSTATVQLGANYQLYGANTTINAQGQLNLNNFNEYIGTLVVSGGGSVVTGTGLLYLGGTGITSTASGATSTLTGNYSLVTNQIFNIASGTAPGGTDVLVSGAIGEFTLGSTVTKTGAGTLVLSGANGWKGLTTISAGVLNIQNASGLGTVDAGTTVSSGAALQIQGNIAVGTEALTLNGSGISSDGALRNISGNNSYAGAITLGSGSTIHSDAGALNLSGGIVNGGFTATFGGASNITESGVISGTGALVKNGNGTLTLSASNTYTGATTVNAGTLQVNTNNALGTAASGTTVANGASLTLNNVNYSTAEPLTLNGSGISNGGALHNTGTSTFAGPINAATNATINAGGGTLNLTGGISKNGTTLTIAGGGTVNITTNGITGASPNSDLVVDGTTVVLSAANSYNGPTTVQNSGTLKLGNNNVLPTSPQTAMTINTSSVFDLASYSDGVASLAGDSTATVKNSVVGGTSTLTVNPASGVSTTFAGIIAGTNGGTQGNVALQKTGAGTLVLTGANTYTGSTTVNGGTLTLSDASGSAVGSTNNVSIGSGGTVLLGQNDQINNTAPMTLAGGTFAKGNFSEGSAGAPGIGALTLTATGSKIDFGTGTVGVLTFAAFTPGAFSLTIDNWTGTANTLGSTSTDRLIFASDQTANLSSFSFVGFLPGATEFNLGNGYWEVVPTAVPETSTWVAAALTLGVIGFHFRRRRSRQPARARAKFPQ